MQQDISQFAVAEYQLVLGLPEHITAQIRSERELFAQRFGTGQPPAAPASVLLARGIQYVCNEQRLLHKAAVVAQSFAPFLLELDGFSGQPSHSVHIHVKSRNAVFDLRRHLREAQVLRAISKDLSIYFPEEPLVPLARRLLPYQYEQGWREYQHRPFFASFLVSGMLVLKRSYTGGAARRLGSFDFRALKTQAVQPALF